MQLQINDLLVETDNETIERLTEMYDQLQDDVLLITHQLDQAKMEYKLTGKRADHQWFIRAKFALKKKRQSAQKLQVEIANKKKQRNIKNSNSEDKKFKQAAKRILPQDMYYKILSEALKE